MKLILYIIHLKKIILYCFDSIFYYYDYILLYKYLQKEHNNTDMAQLHLPIQKKKMILTL